MHCPLVRDRPCLCTCVTEKVSVNLWQYLESCVADADYPYELSSLQLVAADADELAISGFVQLL